MNIFKRIKETWNAYLKRMAAENKKEFGSQPLDCCKMNRTKVKDNDRA
ncbi:MAG: LDCC motif putative metal-binding protein [Bilifractor sp.]